MKKYMVVGIAEGKHFSTFADSYTEAENQRLNIVCGLGGYAEVYERVEVLDENGVAVSSEYQLLWS